MKLSAVGVGLNKYSAVAGKWYLWAIEVMIQALCWNDFNVEILQTIDVAIETGNSQEVFKECVQVVCENTVKSR